MATEWKLGWVRSYREGMPLHESDLNRLLNERERIRYALEDMALALEGLAMHAELDTPESSAEGRRRLVIETGIIVSYARPFSGNEVGRIIPNWGGEDTQGYEALHEELIALRDSFYAHTDKPAKSGRSLRVQDDTPAGVLVHEWPGWLPDTNARIRELAEVQRVWLAFVHTRVEAELAAGDDTVTKA